MPDSSASRDSAVSSSSACARKKAARKSARWRMKSAMSSLPSRSAASYAARMFRSGGTTLTIWLMVPWYSSTNVSLYSALSSATTSVSTSSAGTRNAGSGRYRMHTSSSTGVSNTYCCGIQVMYRCRQPSVATTSDSRVEFCRMNSSSSKMRLNSAASEPFMASARECVMVYLE